MWSFKFYVAVNLFKNSTTYTETKSCPIGVMLFICSNIAKLLEKLFLVFMFNAHSLIPYSDNQLWDRVKVKLTHYSNLSIFGKLVSVR